MAMTTTAMRKTRLAVAEPTMSGSCSCSDFSGSAKMGQESRGYTEKPVTYIHLLLHNTLWVNQFVRGMGFYDSPHSAVGLSVSVCASHVYYRIMGLHNLDHALMLVYIKGNRIRRLGMEKKKCNTFIYF